MLSVAKEHLLDRAATPEQKANVEKYVTVHGQELSPTNYAICQADLLIKSDKQAKVHLGNSLIPRDSHSRAIELDRTGKEYGGEILPDVETLNSQAEATGWLLAQPACNQ